MGARHIHYFLTVASPWAYLGHGEFGRICARHEVEIRFRPMPVRRLFDETGGLPLPKRHPVRQAYRLVELQRWREHRGLKLDLQPGHPLGEPALADRTAIAIGTLGKDPMPFLGQAMAGVWAEGRDLSDEGTIADILAGLGHPVDEVLAAARSDDATGSAYEDNLAAALAGGIFGAPSYVMDGEVFWGQDRLDLLAAALASGRAAYRPLRTRGGLLAIRAAAESG